MDEIIKVGMADAKLAFPPKSLTTLGLGSCVGVVLYDTITKKCGMIHIMLPDSTRIRNNSNRSKFADTGIVDMYDELVNSGVKKENIVAKIAGGAKMFSYGAISSDVMNVGEKNVEAAKNILNNLKIKIVAEDTGLNYGRTIVFNSETQKLIIRAVGKPEKEI